MKSLDFHYPCPPDDLNRLQDMMKHMGVIVQNDRKKKVITFDIPDGMPDYNILALGALLGQCITQAQFSRLLKEKTGIDLGL